MLNSGSPGLVRVDTWEFVSVLSTKEYIVKWDRGVLGCMSQSVFIISVLMKLRSAGFERTPGVIFAEEYSLLQLFKPACLQVRVQESRYGE